VVDWLAVDGEAAGIVRHEAFSLCCSDWDVRPFGKYLDKPNIHLPLPQRLVFPLLQNLHSRHSKRRQQG
jgi:hypothetical protein